MSTSVHDERSPGSSPEPSTHGVVTKRRPRAAVIVNPYSSGMTSARERTIITDLRTQLDVDVRRTERAGHAPRIAAELVEAGEVDVIIACGGDGTANEVLNGMPLANGSAADLPAFAVLPAGGTNVLSRSLGYPNHPIRAGRRLAQAIVADQGRVINLGRVDERVFMFAAGVGFDAEIVKRIEMRRSGRRPSDAAHLMAMLGIYAAERFRLDTTMKVTVDETGEQLDASLLIVGNTTPMTYVGRMPVHFMPDCSLDSGIDFVAPAQAGAGFTFGKFTQGMGIMPRRGPSEKMQLRHDVRGINVTCETPMPVQADGEYLGDRTHVRFESIDRAVRLIS